MPCVFAVVKCLGCNVYCRVVILFVPCIVVVLFIPRCSGIVDAVFNYAHMSLEEIYYSVLLCTMVSH